MKYKIARTNDEIDAQMNTAAEWEEHGGSSLPGKTYEEGVLAALRWALGGESEWPIQEEPDNG